MCTLNLFHYKLVEAGIPVEFKGKSKSKAHKVDSDHFKCMGACFSVKLETLIHSQKAKYQKVIKKCTRGTFSVEYGDILILIG